MQGIWTRCCNIISLHRVDAQGAGLSDALPVPPESGLPPPLPSSSCSVDVTPLLPRLFIEPPPMSGALYSGETRHLSFIINATGAIAVSSLVLTVEPASGFSWDNVALQKLLPLSSGSCIRFEVVTDAAIASETVSFVFTYGGAEQPQFQRQITVTMDLSVQTGELMFVNPYVCLFLCWSILMFVNPYVCQYLCLSMFMFVNRHVCQFLCLSVSIFSHLHVCQSLCLSTDVGRLTPCRPSCGKN
jgi:hypothetical protein